jgi:hypothetical protein
MLEKLGPLIVIQHELLDCKPTQTTEKKRKEKDMLVVGV